MDRRQLADRACRGAAPIAVSLLAAGISITPAQADDVKKRPVKLAIHVDLLQDRTADADEGRPRTEEPTPTTAFSFIGMPLTFGSRDAAIDQGPGIEAGLYADYDSKLADRMTLSARAGLSKTRYLSDGWGTDTASAAATWRYGDDDLAVSFEPSWRVTVVETVIAARDYGAALRLESGIADGLSLVNGLRYGQHDAAAIGEDWSTGTARTALSYRFGKRGSLDFSFDASYTLSKENGRKVGNLGELTEVANSFAPAIAMSFPLSDEIDFAASFRYCRSTDELPRFDDDPRNTEDSQHLDMRLAWHNTDPALKDIDFSASYAFDRLATTEADADSVGHTIALALAMSF